MSRYSLLALLFLTSVVAALPASGAEDLSPNFIVIIADDLGGNDSGFMGNRGVRTPHLDRLAAAGLTFDRAFLTCSSCSPSRSSIMTGRYPHSTDAEQLHWPLPADQQTFAEVLHQQGYYTAAAGKWHLGPSAKRGFDKVDEASSQGFQLPVDSAGKQVIMVDENNASGCAGWVPLLANRPTDKPFFLWLASLDPHRDYAENILAEPHQASDAILPPFIPDTLKVREDFAAYYDEVTRLDSYIGAVLDEVDRQGIADNTYVIFLSDNGRPFPRCKTTLFDSGIHTPLVVRCAGRVPEGVRTNALVSSIDLSATILDLAGAVAPESIQGKSFQAVLGDPDKPHREYVFAEHNWHDYDAYQRAVRSAKYKYIRNFDSNLSLTPPADAVRSDTFVEMRRLRDAGELDEIQLQCFVAPRPVEELYDLEADPDELHNLAIGTVATDRTLAETLVAYRKLIDQWRIDTEDGARTMRSADEFDRETGVPLPARQRPRAGKEDGFQPLFNGKDLRGWKRTNTAESTWVVEGELLVCSGKPIGELRTERMYQNFVLELEWRHLVPGGNAGIFIWADDITAKGVPFHRGIEVQVLENAYGQSQAHTTHGDIFPIHGAKMTPINGRGGDRAFPTQSLSRPSPEWNHYRIVGNDGELSLFVNGVLVTRGVQCNPKKGYICLESEGGVVHYRNVRIKELPDTPIEPSEVAISNRGYRSLYQGIDLSGWRVSSGTSWKSSDWVLAHRPAVDAASADSILTSDTQWDDAKFVVDFKRPNDASQMVISFRNLHVDTAVADVAKSLSKPGSWDRLEFSQFGKQCRLAINGKTVLEQEISTSVASRGPLTIVAQGELDLANLYVSDVPAPN